ncbi:MAG: peptidase M28 [Halobacteriovoraceae bacterium]|nr:peptidase M28 [Halobacteriovoraceae bacterium]|tara:strand:+ start:12892 stop:14196 length:1305 start_codon:yes stop_codon:yes gene_type:complete
MDLSDVQLGIQHVSYYLFSLLYPYGLLSNENLTKGLVMRSIVVMALLMSLASLSVVAKEIYITIGSDAVSSSQKSMKSLSTIKMNSDISVLKVNEKEIPYLSKHMHDKFNRCGGFIVHESKEEALRVLADHQTRKSAKSTNFFNYTITKGETVRNMVSQVSEFGIRDMILKLSQFHNRYYKAQTGVDSQAFVKATWEKIMASRTDAKVEYFKHSAWPQPSVIATLEGTDHPEEVIVIGGHADSIAGFFGRSRARAPGADDNASGISTITEIMRVLADANYKPKRTIQFMAYAAEEVGLLGSKEIANKYKSEGKNVVGVVQLDMTNHKGSKNLDIVFMTDFTNQAQTKFMGSLIDTYVDGVSWGYSKCGYGCSDHASWHNAGYPASMPFESTMQDINGHIHTKNDTIDVAGSGGTADHAEKFARLGIAFAVEMGK